MEITNCDKLGMKWFKFFTKIRPWIVFLAFLSNLGYLIGYISEYEKLNIYSVLFICFSSLCVPIVSTTLNLILFFKKWTNLELLKFVKVIVVLDIIFTMCTYIIGEYFVGTDITVIVIVSIVVLIIGYLVWYRCNIKYFEKRLKFEQNQSRQNQNYGIYNVYGSDIALEQKETSETILTTNEYSSEQYEQLITNNIVTKKQFCSYCGERIDSNTKRCTGCGKKYFKGISGKNLVLIILLIFLLPSFILNIILFNKMNELEDSNVLSTEKLKNFESLEEEIANLQLKNTELQKKAENNPEYVLVDVTPIQSDIALRVASDVEQYYLYISRVEEILANGTYYDSEKEEKVLEYIDNLPIDYGQKIILFRIHFPTNSIYNSDIVDYLNARDDISYDDMVRILKNLGFKVLNDGTVEW